jgi:hypothetical protein
VRVCLTLNHPRRSRPVHRVHLLEPPPPVPARTPRPPAWRPRRPARHLRIAPASPGRGRGRWWPGGLAPALRSPVRADGRRQFSTHTRGLVPASDVKFNWLADVRLPQLPSGIQQHVVRPQEEEAACSLSRMSSASNCSVGRILAAWVRCRTCWCRGSVCRFGTAVGSRGRIWTWHRDQPFGPATTRRGLNRKVTTRSGVLHFMTR